MEEKDKLFQKGFNSGYLIAKYNPDLLEKIVKNSNPSNEFYQGILGGKKEFEREKNKIFSNEPKNNKHEIKTTEHKRNTQKDR